MPARGFFAGGTADKAFDNECTQQRRARAGILAKQWGCTPNQIALAYLRAHAFPVIPILGTLNLDHLRAGIGAGNVTLTAAHAAWLRDGGAL